MAAKGSVLKEEITNKILECFPGSFRYDKEIRIPGIENSENLQIKITLTCAKVNVENGGDTTVLGAAASSKTNIPHSNGKAEIPITVAAGMPNPVEVVEPTEEEKQRVVDLINKLGSI